MAARTNDMLAPSLGAALGGGMAVLVDETPVVAEVWRVVGDGRTLLEVPPDPGETWPGDKLAAACAARVLKSLRVFAAVGLIAPTMPA